MVTGATPDPSYGQKSCYKRGGGVFFFHFHFFFWSVKELEDGFFDLKHLLFFY